MFQTLYKILKKSSLCIVIFVRGPNVQLHHIVLNPSIKSIPGYKGSVYIYSYETLKSGNVTNQCGFNIVRPCPSKKSSIHLMNKETDSAFGHHITYLNGKKV